MRSTGEKHSTEFTLNNGFLHHSSIVRQSYQNPALILELAEAWWEPAGDWLGETACLQAFKVICSPWCHCGLGSVPAFFELMGVRPAGPCSPQRSHTSAHILRCICRARPQQLEGRLQGQRSCRPASRHLCPQGATKQGRQSSSSWLGI